MQGVEDFILNSDDMLDELEEERERILGAFKASDTSLEVNKGFAAIRCLFVNTHAFDHEKNNDRATSNADSERHLFCSASEHGVCRGLSSREPEY